MWFTAFRVDVKRYLVTSNSNNLYLYISMYSQSNLEIDLNDYSFLPNSLVSMLTLFSIISSDRNYIPMFSRTELFLVCLRLNNK